MAQLGPVSPPITGPTPADVPGENQISEANTAVRDDGLPGGRGLVRSQPCTLAIRPFYKCFNLCLLRASWLTDQARA